MDDAFEYAMKHPLCTAVQYPYADQRGKCQCNHTLEAEGSVRVKALVDLPSGNESAMAFALAIQPLSASVEADKASGRFEDMPERTEMLCDHIPHSRTSVPHGPRLRTYTSLLPRVLSMPLNPPLAPNPVSVPLLV